MSTILLFHMDLAKNSSLINGRLLLLDADKSLIIERYIATSGRAGSQSFEMLGTRSRGPIPPQYECNILMYTVETKPIYMPHVVGVEGNFYKINPHNVKVWGKGQRGDFGIHADKNLPGSAGCIVLPTEEGWKGFQQKMSEIASSGVNSMPLLVSYAR